MESLSGAYFEFYVAEPWKKWHRGDNYHKQIERELLIDFQSNFGGEGDPNCLPLLNKNLPQDRGIAVDGGWWRKPLKRSGNRTDWILEPGPNSSFRGALD